jgi:hypothetical protein
MVHLQIQEFRVDAVVPRDLGLVTDEPLVSLKRSLDAVFSKCAAERPGSNAAPQENAMTTPLLVVDHQLYADVKDRRLAVMLAEEDAAEELGLNPLERVSCRLHRWCRDCCSTASVGVDELTGDVLVRCESCHRTPRTSATQQTVRACRASLAAAQCFFSDVQTSLAA